MFFKKHFVRRSHKWNPSGLSSRNIVLHIFSVWHEVWGTGLRGEKQQTVLSQTVPWRMFQFEFCTSLLCLQTSSHAKWRMCWRMPPWFLWGTKILKYLNIKQFTNLLGDSNGKIQNLQRHQELSKISKSMTGWNWNNKALRLKETLISLWVQDPWFPRLVETLF